MAERAVNDPVHANLECPLCFTIFEKATLLTCGHTFCQKCLIGYDMGHQDMSHMICPLCRGQTPFGENRVQGLPQNVTVNALVSDIQANMLPEKGLAQPQAAGPAQPLLPTIIKEVALPGGIRGMTSMGQDTVVVGYGSSFPGAEAIKVSGDRKPYLGSDVGPVRDIVILNDGRAVVSHGLEEIKAYNSEGTLMWVIPFQQLAKKNDINCFPTLYKDSQDNVYTANCTNKIQYFRVCDKGITSHSGVITTGTALCRQICVTQTEILVIRLTKTNPGILAFFDKEGNAGSIVPARYENEVLCATVDALDRVIIAYFSALGTLTLSVCTLTGLHIKHQYFLSELHLSPPKQIWCYMVSITPELLAFANLEKKLYFIKVPPIPKT